jgi:SAM-dependent methyltransferase
LRRFAQRLPPHARVLDYGCGIGTDLAWLAHQGCRVEGLDGTRVFAREARRRCPAAIIRQERFETAALAPAAYDGIWCCAALIHVPPQELRRQLAKLRHALQPGGRLGLTLAWGRARAFTQRDWIPGRYLAAYSKSEARAFLRGWRVEEIRVISGGGRRGRWIQMLGRAL